MRHNVLSPIVFLVLLCFIYIMRTVEMSSVMVDQRKYIIWSY